MQVNMNTYSSANDNVFISGLNRAAFQKESFWHSKRVLLECKRSPFSIQKEPFCIANVVLLQNKKITHASQKGCTVFYMKLIAYQSNLCSGASRRCIFLSCEPLFLPRHSKMSFLSSGRI